MMDLLNDFGISSGEFESFLGISSVVVLLLLFYAVYIISGIIISLLPLIVSKFIKKDHFELGKIGSLVCFAISIINFILGFIPIVNFISWLLIPILIVTSLGFCIYIFIKK